jgi:hypothetical protein
MGEFDSVAKWRHRYAVTEAKERVIVAALAWQAQMVKGTGPYIEWQAVDDNLRYTVDQLRALQDQESSI